MPHYRLCILSFQGALDMKCPICGESTLVHGVRDVAYAYKGQSVLITAVEGDSCPACGENVFDAEESSRVSLAMLAFNRQVDESLDRGLMLK